MFRNIALNSVFITKAIIFMIGKHDDMCDILLRYYEGKLDEEHRLEVEKWIGLSNDNLEIASTIKSLYQDIDTLYVLERADKEKALKRVHRKMYEAKIYYVLKWSQRIAALLFIPVLILAWLLYSYNRESPVNQILLKTNPGMVASTTLPDGTKVTLNTNTILYFPSCFKGQTRNVQLRGEAFFDVKKDKSHPFIISTPQKASIKVYGTKFNVEAYAEDDIVTATLITGSISMLCQTKNNLWNEYKISPHQKIEYSNSYKECEIINTSTLTETSWKDGTLIFQNTPFADVIRSLSKRFNVRFVVKSPRCYESSFTGILRHQRLERILEYFHLSSGLHFKMIDNNRLDNEKQTIEVY